MKQLNQFKMTYQNGKELKKEHLAVRSVMDSVADNLIIDSPHILSDAKTNFPKGKIMTFEIWEEIKEAPKAKKEKN